MSIFHTHTGKQILGALSGMVAASVLYFGWQSLDQASLSARLVETQTISDTVETIQTNAKNLDEVKRRMLERRAQQVASQLRENTTSSLVSSLSTSLESVAPITALTEFTNPIVLVAPTQKERIQSRVDPQRMIHSEESDGTFHRATEADTQHISEVPVVANNTNTLPGSGAGMIFLFMISSGIAGYHLFYRRRKSL